MLFNSYVFILLFFPVFAIGFFLLRRTKYYQGTLLFLIVMSLLFYGYQHVRYVPLILCSIVVNFLFSKSLMYAAWQERKLLRKGILWGGLLFNLGLIFYYKYHDFFFENINHLFGTHVAMGHLLLPLGISFFTFQQLSFVVDSYHLETKGYTFLEYAAFVCFFPQLVAGPIVLHDELIPQFRTVQKSPLDWNGLSLGLYRFTLGLSKKVLIADTFAKAVDWGFQYQEMATSIDLIIVMLSYTFQIYFDFSGYSDMAIGMAQMIGIKLPANFDSPYQALTIRGFWKGWHMTLTRFLTKYVYIPLGGSKGNLAKTCVNMFLVFLFSGIWHGANWTFILWGVLHGLLCIGERIFQKQVNHIPKWLSFAVTFGLINVLWLLFRADSVSQWLFFLKRICAFDTLKPSVLLVNQFEIPERDLIFKLLYLRKVQAAFFEFGMLLFFLVASVLCFGCKNFEKRIKTLKPITLPVCVILLVWSVISLSNEAVFLYFNF